MKLKDNMEELAGNAVFPDRTKKTQDILDLLKKHGFQVWHTGGGCMAMVKEFADGVICMITDNDAGLDNLEEEMSIGFETADGDPILCVSTKGMNDIFVFEQLGITEKEVA